jgi:hypothetical protein
MQRICPECGSTMEEMSPTLWVCPVCKLVQFQDEQGNMQTRYPHPVRLDDEEKP